MAKEPKLRGLFCAKLLEGSEISCSKSKTKWTEGGTFFELPMNNVDDGFFSKFTNLFTGGASKGECVVECKPPEGSPAEDLSGQKWVVKWNGSNERPSEPLTVVFLSAADPSMHEGLLSDALCLEILCAFETDADHEQLRDRLAVFFADKGEIGVSEGVMSYRRVRVRDAKISGTVRAEVQRQLFHDDAAGHAKSAARRMRFTAVFDSELIVKTLGEDAFDRLLQSCVEDLLAACCRSGGLEIPQNLRVFGGFSRSEVLLKTSQARRLAMALLVYSQMRLKKKKNRPPVKCSELMGKFFATEVNGDPAFDDRDSASWELAKAAIFRLKQASRYLSRDPAVRGPFQVEGPWALAIVSLAPELFPTPSMDNFAATLESGQRMSTVARLADIKIFDADAFERYRHVATGLFVKLAKKEGLAAAGAAFQDILEKETMCREYVQSLRGSHGRRFEDRVEMINERDFEYFPSMLADALLADLLRSISEDDAIFVAGAVCCSRQTSASGHLAEGDRELLVKIGRLHGRRAATAVDWEWCMGRGAGDAAAHMSMAIAGDWLSMKGDGSQSVSAFLEQLRDDFAAIDEDGPCNTDLHSADLLTRVASRVFAADDRLAEAFVKGKHIEIKKLREHQEWVRMIQKACGTGQGPEAVHVLSKTLQAKNLKIPVSFLRFLATPRHDEDNAPDAQNRSLLRVYAGILLGETSFEALQHFLPATDSAKIQAQALGKLRRWISSLSVEGGGQVERTAEAFREKIQSASLPYFPDCLGHTSGDTHLAKLAVDAFKDEAMSSELVKIKARNRMRRDSEGHLQEGASDAKQLVFLARQDAKQHMEAAFEGKMTFFSAKPYAQSHASADVVRREWEAIYDLLGWNRPESMTRRDPIRVYMRLVQSDPDQIIEWARCLESFCKNVLKVEPEESLCNFVADFCDKGLDFESMPLFSGPIRQTLEVSPPAADATTSIHMLLERFAALLSLSSADKSRRQLDLQSDRLLDESCWREIPLLPEIAPLIDFFRASNMQRHALVDKLNALRVMCVTTRDMSRSVAALDSIAIDVHVLSRCQETPLRFICELLKSQLLGPSVGSLAGSSASAAGAEAGGGTSTRVSSLVHLLRLTESAEQVANRNAELLKASTIVLDLRKCDDIVSGKDPFEQTGPRDMLRVECGAHGPFRLAGGLAKSVLEGCDINALFIETLVQTSSGVSAAHDKQGGDGAAAVEKDRQTVEVAQIRVACVQHLASLYHELARLGRRPGSSVTEQFPTSTPESQSFDGLFYEKQTRAKVSSHTHDVNKTLGRVGDELERLRSVLVAAKNALPWLSHCPRMDLMHKRSTPWFRFVANSSLEMKVLTDEEPKRQDNDVVRWARSQAIEEKRTVRASDVKPSSIPDSFLRGCRAAAVPTVDGKMMSMVVGCLVALGEWPSPSPTALFACDESVVPSAILELAWRLETAAKWIVEWDSIPEEDHLSGLNDRDGWDQREREVRGMFLSRGVVISRLDLAPLPLQDLLLVALDKYVRAGHERHAARFPKVLLLTLASKQEGDRGDSFAYKLGCFVPQMRGSGDSRRAQSNEGGMQDAIAILKVAEKAPMMIHRPAKIVGRELLGMTCGQQQSLVSTYRIQPGGQLQIRDFVQSVHQAAAQGYSIVLDFGGGKVGDGGARDGALDAALASLLLCGTVGQAQHAVAVLPQTCKLIVECVAKCENDTVGILPILKWLNCSFSMAPELPREIVDAASNDAQVGDAFRTLIEHAGRGTEPVKDGTVVTALKSILGNTDSLSPLRLKPGRGMPFVHTPSSLRTMGLVVARLRAAASEEGLQKGRGQVAGCHVPILVSGDTGTGKTYVLLKLVELLRQSGSRLGGQLGRDLHIFSLSAAFGRQEVEFMGCCIRKEALSGIVCPVVLDEITSSPSQEALARLICRRETQDGVPDDIAVGSALVLATCNPDPVRDAVFPLAPELARCCIRTDQRKEDREAFVRSQLQDNVRGPGLEGEELREATCMVLKATEALEAVPVDQRIGTVSLRDSVRCASLARRLCQDWNRAGGSTRNSFFNSLSDGLPDGEAWVIESEKEQALVLACYLCYGMRVVPRQAYFQKFPNRSNDQPLIEQTKSALIRSLAIPPGVVETPALRDNMLAIIVAVSSRLPLLSLGDDGTSKTLSFTILLRQMQGRFSTKPLLQSLRRAQLFPLQLSDATRAEHIGSLKKAVVEWGRAMTESLRADLTMQSVPCICMEEMSMADEQTLRALHDLLDSHQESRDHNEDVGAGANFFGFLATSNYRSESPTTLPTGRALGNRLLVLAHETPPRESLIELANACGLDECPKDAADARETVRRTIHRICGGKTSDGSMLVPTVISIRSLLYFARTVAKLCSHTDLSEEAVQRRAFAAHLQLPSEAATRAVEVRVAAALGWKQSHSESVRCEDIVADAFGSGRTRRPLLFLYSGCGDIATAVDTCRRHCANGAKEWLICPATSPLVSVGGKKGLDRSAAFPGVSMNGGLVLDTTHAMVKLRSALEAGGTIYLLNPEVMLDGIHALLNDAAREQSQLQMRESTEVVIIHPSVQIVLLCSRASACGMHRAFLSRVAVVNSGRYSFGPRRGISSAFSQLCQHYECDVVSRLHDHVQVNGEEVMRWLKKELELLGSTELSLDGVLDALHDKNFLKRRRLIVALAHGPLSWAVCNERAYVRYVDAAAAGSTASTFLVETLKGLAEVEDGRNGKTMLLLDLTTASSEGSADALAMLGLLGPLFTSGSSSASFGNNAGSSNGSGREGAGLLQRVKDNHDIRVVVALNVASLCTGCFEAKKPIKVIEIRKPSEQFADWPMLEEMAGVDAGRGNDCALALRKRAIELITAKTLNGLDTSVHVDFSDDSFKLREQLVKIALCYFRGGEAERLLLIDSQPKRHPLHARVRLFRSLAKEVAEDASRIFTVRTKLIDLCRKHCHKIAAMLLGRLPASVIAKPTMESISIVERLLQPVVFLWQVSAGGPTEAAGFEHARLSCQVKRTQFHHAFPFLSDILDTLKRSQGGSLAGLAGKMENMKKALDRSFPTLGALRLVGESSRGLAESLVTLLLERAPGGSIGRSRDGPVMWLMNSQWTNGTLPGVLSFYLKWGPWISLGSLMNVGDQQNSGIKGEFEAFMLGFVTRALLSGNVSAEGFGGALRAARELQIALRQNFSKPSPDVKQSLVWLRQVVKFWMAQGCAKSSTLRLVCQALAGGAEGGEAAGTVIADAIPRGRLTFVLSALIECHLIRPLDAHTIAGVLVALDMKGMSGSAAISFLAAVLDRCSQHKSSKFDFTSQKVTMFEFMSLVLQYALQRQEDSEYGTAGTITAAAASAMRIVGPPPFEALEYLAAGKNGQAGLLAVAAVAVPGLVDALVAGDEEGEGGGYRAVQELVCGKEALLKKIFAASGLQTNSAIRHYFVRCLVARLGERHLMNLKPWLPHAVGEWVQEFLVEVLDGPLKDLDVVNSYAQALAKVKEWPAALCAAITSQEADDIHMVETVKMRLIQELGTGDEDAAALDLEFCLLPAAMWCVMLASLAPDSPLAAPIFDRREQWLGSCYPCSDPGTIEMLRSLPDVTSVNRCPCGYLYGIGECGQPMVEQTCPDCGGRLGGTGHRWATGANHGTAVAHADDVIRGVPEGWFQGGCTASQRDLSPLHYRILSVLILLPAAVFGAWDGDGDANVQPRRRQLARHWNELKIVAKLSTDLDCQHFLLGLLERVVHLPSVNSASSRDDVLFGGWTFEDKSKRNSAETAFTRRLTELLGEGAASTTSPLRITGEVQELLHEREQKRPVVKLRESVIAKLAPKEASLLFAPLPLKVQWDEAKLDPVEEVVRQANSQQHPLLARAVACSGESDPHGWSQGAGDVDPGVSARLAEVPSMVQALLALHSKASESQPLGLGMTVEQLVWGQESELANVWEACRYGHRIGCQDVPDIGPILKLPVRLVVWLDDERDLDGEQSRTEAMLRCLSEQHNEIASLVWEDDGEEIAHEDASANSLPFRPPVVDICRESEALKAAHIPLAESFFWLKKALPCFPAAHRTADKAEAALRQWLRLRGCGSEMTVEVWPRVVTNSSGVVRLPAETQVALSPEELQKLKAERSQPAYDEATLCLEWLQLAAAVVLQSRGGTHALGVSPLTQLHRLTDDVRMELPAALQRIFQATGVGCVRHLNALQQHFSDRLDGAEMHDLGREYQDELPLDSQLREGLEAMLPRHRELLRMKLVTLACDIKRSPMKPNWGLDVCVESVDIDGLTDTQEDEAAHESMQAGLKGLHLAHLVSTLKAVCKLARQD